MEPATGAAPFLSNQPDRRPQHLAIPGSTDHNALLGHFQGLSLTGMTLPAPQSAPVHMPPPYMVSPDGLILASMPGSQSVALNHPNESAYPGYQINGAYANPYALSGPLVPFTPARANAGHPRGDRTQSEVPGLENRRGSYSTTESAPATPFYGSWPNREHGPRVHSDRSAYTTPSPHQLLGSHHVEATTKAKPSPVSDHVLDEILAKEPAIPTAVPAVFTPAGQMKSLEQSLENRIPGNRNVYIRGLYPTTDDHTLYQFTSRFGEVETSKAIIDTGTGACKGFGFAKFFDVAHSEMCIRGFHRLGYEESFNSRLKAEGDDDSTNLYISNLPKSLTEVELGAIFRDYTILSSKILRDSMGNSRGVGFARFENRDICDDVIERFHGSSVGDEGLLMNIRYADTPAQKELKRVTAERRQFRTNEYNIGAYGTPLVGYGGSMYPHHAQNRRAAIPITRPPMPPAPSVSDTNNETRRLASQRQSIGTAAIGSTDEVIATPVSSECGENTTVHVDAVVAGSSFDASPSIKKEIKKDAMRDIKKEI
ncbi:sporulation-specific 5 [Fusarium phyllophilum]|uniref:Sporulation-specific 5 n=1 Tax=Fusarium phyllophilum TaxID=47803 RepID=A0A8H5KB12_9HYPO|nr:sporulation-specific 5 [Fusarium phyllophilum]